MITSCSGHILRVLPDPRVAGRQPVMVAVTERGHGQGNGRYKRGQGNREQFQVSLHQRFIRGQRAIPASDHSEDQVWPARCARTLRS